MVEKPTVGSEMPSNTPDRVAEERVRLAAIRLGQHGQGPQSDAQQAPGGTQANTTSYSNYLFGRAGADDKPLWSDSLRGRIAIRTFTRGILGAAAMTLVDHHVRGALRNYDPEHTKLLGAGRTKSWSQGVSKMIDATIGKSIQHVVSFTTGAPMNSARVQAATTFRDTTYYFNRDYVGRTFMGRSLGAEMTSVTAGFAAASFADATGRNLIQVLDPNSVKSWMVNDKGEPATGDEKSHFDFGKWAKATLRTSWRIVSKNAGEDWAVALPYVYFMRGQRNILNKYWPDMKWSLDHGYNGGSTHLDARGKPVGNFEIPAAIDWTTRFPIYNYGTLMYREMYDAIGRGIKKWKDNNYEVKIELSDNPLASVVDTVAYGARYMAKSFIKANLYMIPAMAFFSPMRVAQSRWQAAPLLAGKGEHGFAVATNLDQSAGIANGPPYTFPASSYNADPGLHLRNANAPYFDGNRAMQGPSYMHRRGGMYSIDYIKDLWKTNKSAAVFSAALNPLGWASYQAGTGLTKLANLLPNHRYVNTFIPLRHDTPLAKSREMFTRTFVDNATAYMPYMIAKAETALRVDERPADGGLGEMDTSIYRLIDSAASFDIKGMGKAFGDIKKYALNTDRKIVMREGDPVVVAKQDVPETTVAGSTINLDQARQAAGDERSWAETVAGRPLGERFQSSGPTLH